MSYFLIYCKLQESELCSDASNKKNFKLELMKEISQRFMNKKYLIISESELNELLKLAQRIHEQDTKIRGFVRILKIEDKFYFQEATNQGEIMIRHFGSEAEAMNLVNNRMQIYDKMWDGCGCKIDYYE